jgi:hypothetical protein
MLAERYAARLHAPVYMYSLDWQSPAHGGRVKAHDPTRGIGILAAPEKPGSVRLAICVRGPLRRNPTYLPDASQIRALTRSFALGDPGSIEAFHACHSATIRS